MNGVRGFVPDNVLHLLRAARHRKNMELADAERESGLTGYALFPSKFGSAAAAELFEYLLILDLQQKTGLLMDFVRGISPALSRLFELFLEKKCRRQVRRIIVSKPLMIPTAGSSSGISWKEEIPRSLLIMTKGFSPLSET